MTEFWEGLGRSARAGLLVGLVVILALTGAFAWWSLRSDYQVLFSDLKPQDASAMVAELEKLKIPYKVDDASASILVDKSQVHSARIKLMGKEFPLHGAVGFELFNNTDFGMTEFAQKINYQRALQGELTRTILSLSEVRDVRVHLALPEQGLFKQPSVRPKAAITLSLREGHALRPEQVSGIQRLVAAATPGMTAQDVTVVDKQGMALSRSPDEAAEGFASTAGSARLELKKETEMQLARKASAVLDKAFGAGEALASVDVTLNMDQVRVTTEDVIPAPTRSPESRGVIVKERESIRDAGTPSLDVRSAATNAGSSQREVDYQVGRRVEQVTSQAGAVRRIQVVAVVRQHLDALQEEKLKRLLGAAVGVVAERGDAVVVQSLNALLPSAAAQGESSRGIAAAEAGGLQADRPSDGGLQAHAPDAGASVAAYLKILIAVGVIGLGFFWVARTRRNRGRGPALSEAERQAALRKVTAWMQESGAGPDSVNGRPANRMP
ncbi:flagellar M-ring protein FliF [Acidovorax sp. Leaf84]|uniref:flagellar basal-body MS-ring/collar protein FliF n=1 Tax=Acidovorax sp. Leaf84 TaxID=1736240 RepID=UPI0007001147|nr:flagellar basal-body MS-ring/collar protein FliF [Acidovorax sp. Leaf84]KQO35424.1 flagellar M-ring protein FliF [Acidovorax sp. Leaf84]